MKILYLVNHFNSGGITSYILSLSSGLIKKGHSVFVASGGGKMLFKLDEEGIKYFTVPIKTKNELSPRIIISALILSKIIRDNRIDLVHSQSRTTQVLGCLLARMTGARHIFTCHGFFKRRFSRRIFPCWGESVIAISEQVKEHLISDFKVRPEKISLVFNGVDSRKFSPVLQSIKQEAKQKIGLSPDTVVGVLARLSDVKGHRYLIEGMKSVLSVYPAAQLLIAGEGRMEEELKALVNDLGIGKNVFFIPNSTDTKNVLSAIDIFVLPSLKEGLGLALMEAMSMGLPVIGSEVGGIKTLIKNGINGLLVKPKDCQGISKAVIDLISDPALGLKLGAEARKYIVNEFSCENMVSGTEEVYLKAYS